MHTCLSPHSLWRVWRVCPVKIASGDLIHCERARLMLSAASCPTCGTLFGRGHAVMSNSTLWKMAGTTKATRLFAEEIAISALPFPTYSLWTRATYRNRPEEPSVSGGKHPKDSDANALAPRTAHTGLPLASSTATTTNTTPKEA